MDAVTLEYRVRHLLGNPARLAEMAARARALGRPDAAQQVLARVLEGIADAGPQPAAAAISRRRG